MHGKANNTTGVVRTWINTLICIFIVGVYYYGYCCLGFMVVSKRKHDLIEISAGSGSIQQKIFSICHLSVVVQ